MSDSIIQAAATQASAEAIAQQQVTQQATQQTAAGFQGVPISPGDVLDVTVNVASVALELPQAPNVLFGILEIAGDTIGNVGSFMGDAGEAAGEIAGAILEGAADILGGLG